MILKKLKIKRSLIVSLSALLICCTFTTTSFVENNLDSKNQNNFDNDSLNAQSLEDLSVDQLIEIRDKAIDENLEPLREFGEDAIQRRKDSILTFDFGLVAFVDKTYNNLNQKEKLIKQIEIVDYENNINDVIDPSGGLIEGIHRIYQISQYLLEKGKDPKYYESYDSLKFLIDNLQELCDFVGSDFLKDSIESIQSSIGLQSQEQQQSLSKDFKKACQDDNLSKKVKKAIKSIDLNN